MNYEQACSRFGVTHTHRQAKKWNKQQGLAYRLAQHFGPILEQREQAIPEIEATNAERRKENEARKERNKPREEKNNFFLMEAYAVETQENPDAPRPKLLELEPMLEILPLPEIHDIGDEIKVYLDTSSREGMR